jgi:hypothetical protein
MLLVCFFELMLAVSIHASQLRVNVVDDETRIELQRGVAGELLQPVDQVQREHFVSLRSLRMW